MKVGDLVICMSIDKMGIIVEKFKVSGLFGVMLTHNNAMGCFQPQHLMVVNAGR